VESSHPYGLGSQPVPQPTTFLRWAWLDWTDLDWTGLAGLDWTWLDSTWLDWTGLVDWTGLDESLSAHLLLGLDDCTVGEHNRAGMDQSHTYRPHHQLIEALRMHAAAAEDAHQR